MLIIMVIVIAFERQSGGVHAAIPDVGPATILQETALPDPLKDLKVYRDRLKGLYVVARSLFLLLLTCSACPCLGPA